MLGILQKQFEMAIKAIEKIKKKSAEHESQLLALFLDEFNILCRHILGSFRDLKSFLKSYENNLRLVLTSMCVVDRKRIMIDKSMLSGKDTE